MMSLSLVAVPVLLDTVTDTAQLLRQWSRMYHYGHLIMPSLAVGTLCLHGCNSVAQRSLGRPYRLFALAGMVTIAIAPFTWIAMDSTNNELFRLEAAARESNAESLHMALARELIVRWTWLHTARSMLPLVGTILGSMATFTST
jgi:hypothetical protein